MAGKRKKPLSQTTAARRRRETIRQKKLAQARRKAAPKIRAYNSLANDYLDKQKKNNKKLDRKNVRQSDGFKKVYAELKRGGKMKAKALKKKDYDKVDEANKIMLDALKETTRRDGIPDTIPVGETPKVGG